MESRKHLHLINTYMSPLTLSSGFLLPIHRSGIQDGVTVVSFRHTSVSPVQSRFKSYSGFDLIPDMMYKEPGCKHRMHNVLNIIQQFSSVNLYSTKWQQKSSQGTLKSKVWDQDQSHLSSCRRQWRGTTPAEPGSWWEVVCLDRLGWVEREKNRTAGDMGKT